MRWSLAPLPPERWPARFGLMRAVIFIGSGKISYGKLSQALGTLSEAKIFIDDTPSIGVLEMRAKCRRLQADAGDFDMPAKWRIGQVAQDMPETDQAATDACPASAPRSRSGPSPARWSPTRTPATC